MLVSSHTEMEFSETEAPAVVLHNKTVPAPHLPSTNSVEGPVYSVSNTLVGFELGAAEGSPVGLGVGDAVGEGVGAEETNKH